MINLNIYGGLEDTLIFSGAIEEEFHLPIGSVFTGLIAAPNGDSMTVEASYGVDNPDGWSVKIVDAELIEGPPWPYTVGKRFSTNFHNEDYESLTIQIPEDSDIVIV